MENENIVNQPVKEKKSIKKVLLTIAAVFVVGLLVLIALFVQKESSYPQESTFYVGEYNNQPTLFYRYADMIINDELAPRTTGHIVPLDRPYNISVDRKVYIDFKELKNAKKIFNFNRHAGVQNYMLNEDKSILMISYVGGPTDTTNYIYQFNLKTAESKKVWEHELRTGPQPYNGGIAYITEFIQDQYVAFAIIKSVPPPQEMPVGIIVRNIESGSEKVLGQVGDIQINPDRNEVTYRNLAKTKVPCEGKDDPVCFATDTYKMSLLPAGDAVTEPLP